jgi:hypothetical protein
VQQHAPELRLSKAFVFCVCSGKENLIRFNNKIEGKYYPLGSFPCAPKYGRPLGRPVSIHLHGSPSLAPYDGWADDVTCSNETKDYIYPNVKPSTMWYHDHALHETARNAYSGERPLPADAHSPGGRRCVLIPVK